MPQIYALILAGGSGTRLWPRSRQELPKQFLSLNGDGSLLQQTLTRMLTILPAEHMHAIAGGAWDALVMHQAREVAPVKDDFVINEPCARNTAPAIVLGCEFLKTKGAKEDDIVIVVPSDHIIKNIEAFEASMHQAVNAAINGHMMVLGIVPVRPDTGFGYIKRGNPEGQYYKVEGFVEKPSYDLAVHYLNSGEYYWNGGIFIFSLKTFQAELAKTAPELSQMAGVDYSDFVKNFANLPSISFDYAVLEKSSSVAMVELNAGWSDVGSWDALHEVLDKDADDNAAMGDVLLQGCSNCLVDGQNRLLTLVDVEDLIVVDSPDALFVTKRGSSQKVRNVVDFLKAKGRKEAEQAPESARPWGTYKILCEEERFKIKRIVIVPGKRLSLQYHHHRSEHWIVVKGTALVTVDGKERFVHEGESIFIPKSALHRLENPGKVDLEIVEIQGGEYLGEDDIVRVEDDYKRI